MTEYTLRHEVIPCGNADVDPEVSARFARMLEKSLRETLMGLQPAPKPTALRYRHGRVETVELDSAGNIIEPVRCSCGSRAVFHSSRCPFAYGVT